MTCIGIESKKKGKEGKLKDVQYISKIFTSSIFGYLLYLNLFYPFIGSGSMFS